MPRNDGTLTFVRPGNFGDMRAGYLVTVVRGGRQRPLVWRPPEPLPLDLREEWEMHWMPEGLSARQFSGTGDQRRPRQVIPIPDRAIDTGAAVALFGSPENDRPDFAVRVQRLRPILAPNKRAPTGTVHTAMAYLYSGAGDDVTDAVPITNEFSVVVDERRAVDFSGDGRGAVLIASLPGFQCRTGDGPPVELVPNVPQELDLGAGEFLEIRAGRLWWCLTTVPMPEAFALGPEDAPTAEEEQETSRFRRLASVCFVSTLIAVTAALLFAPPAKKTVVHPAEPTDIRIQPPKRVAAAAPMSVPTQASKMVVEAPAPAKAPASTWFPEPTSAIAEPPPERPRGSSLAETINRAAGNMPREEPPIDARIRSPRQERRRRETADLGDLRLTVTGSGRVERSAVEGALEQHLGEFQRCYVTALGRNGAVRGVLQMEWTIARSGGVSDVVILRSDIPDEPMHRCVEEELRRVRFPVPQDGAVRVRYPFIFRSLGE